MLTMPERDHYSKFRHNANRLVYNTTLTKTGGMKWHGQNQFSLLLNLQQRTGSVAWMLPCLANTHTVVGSIPSTTLKPCMVKHACNPPTQQVLKQDGRCLVPVIHKFEARWNTLKPLFKKTFLMEKLYTVATG